MDRIAKQCISVIMSSELGSFFHSEFASDFLDLKNVVLMLLLLFFLTIIAPM